MEYNTQREQLKISDYGRTICKLIDYAKTIENREERTAMANTIVEAMAMVNPKVKEKSDYRRTLWDHLMLIANYELDVDSPYPVAQREEMEMKPHPLALPENKIRYPHYGRSLELMVKAVAEMPEGEERQRLTELVAHAMKRQYLQWNRDSVDDQLIVDQMAELSGGRLTPPEGFKFHNSQEYVEEMKQAAEKKDALEAKKKKKKKKKKAGKERTA